MAKLMRAAGLAGILAVFGLVIGYFSYRPSYTHFPPDKAMIKISFTLSGKPKGKCHRRSRAELLKLAPNMRRLTVCPRERLPVRVELMLDGKLLYRASLPPSGLAKDGPSRVYQGFTVAPGKRRIVARLTDSNRTTGFDYETTAEVVLRSRQHFIVDFRRDRGGYIFR